MHYPQIFIGQIPPTAAQRRALRALALDLRIRLRPPRDPLPTLILLNIAVEGVDPIDLLVARPNTLIIGALRSFDGPLTAELDGRWIDTHGRSLHRDGQSPLAAVGNQRDTLRARLVESLPPGIPAAQVITRMIAALICIPTLHPESQIAIDIEDHRALRKVLGLDELAGLAAMTSTATRISEHALHALIAEHLGGQLWHDGTRLLFELAPPPYRLRLIGDEPGQRPVLPLIEGENLIGRRRTARPHEHRLTIAGDDRISSDHAAIICTDDQRVILRDTSKNGTWFTLPNGPEAFLGNTERPIIPGTIIRMGETRMQLEAAEINL
jgi:hypothetical protein